MLSKICLQVVQLRVIFYPPQCWGMLHLQKYYFGFWLLVAWKLNLESSDICLTHTVFAWQHIFSFSRDFVSVSWCSAYCCSWFAKAKELCSQGVKGFALVEEHGDRSSAFRCWLRKERLLLKSSLSFPSVPWQSTLGAPQAGSPVQGILYWQSSGILLKASRPGSVCFIKSLFVS